MSNMRLYWICIGAFVSVVSRGTRGYSFNVDSVQVISQNSVKNTYFSYSLLLQGGESASTLIVGAPKGVDQNDGGNIYKCDLRDVGSGCSQFVVGRSIDTKTPNGNSFGMVLDGDNNVNGPIVSCAPHSVPPHGRSAVNYLRGYCVYLSNSSDITQSPLPIIPFQDSKKFPDIDKFESPFYYFAYAMAGFDVSYYSQNEILLGAPGIRSFTGSTVLFKLEGATVKVLPDRAGSQKYEKENSYFGYAVTAANFQKNKEDVWYMAGAPRANNLKGKVTIYYNDNNRMHTVATFEGEDTGSYFGSALLATDLTNDRIVDILIGAPMSAGKTWDEGCVFVYKGLNERSFVESRKLVGSSKIGSRFGSAIVSLGDFDLDGHNDVAIAAPYEDDGVGAVYIYKGTTDCLAEKYSQRISPSDLNIGGITVKGFGRGISRGNDIDGNGHNDIAIGAYKTDQVFIIKSYSIIDYRVNLNSNILSITNDTRKLNAEVCIFYTERSGKNLLTELNFNVSIELDYRASQNSINDEMTAFLSRRGCKSYPVELRKMFSDISPFSLTLYLSTARKDIVAQGERVLSIQIPFSHGCGDDNQCDTDLSIELQTDREKITLGFDKQIDLKVIINNDGEPAYQTKVHLAVSKGLELRNAKDCVKTEGNYTCLVSEMFVGSIEKHFLFDVIDIEPDCKTVEFRAAVISLGVNKPESKSSTELNVPIVLDSTPYIVVKSVPEYSELELKNYLEDIEVTHQFSIGKNGPSPLPIHVELLVPIEWYEDRSIIVVTEVEAKIGNILVECSNDVTGIDGDDTDEVLIEDSKISLNRTILFDCQLGKECNKFTCKGEYLFNSGQVADISIKTQINSHLLDLKYKNTFTTKDLVALVVVAREITQNKTISEKNVFLIFVHGVTYIPLWIYLLAFIAAVVLLILLIYGLYKCHFFDRNYKHKLEQEKILATPNTEKVDDMFDEVEFRTLDDNAQNKLKELA